MIYTEIQETELELRLIKSEVKVFNTRYREGLNLLTAVGWSVTEDTWAKYCQMLADIESHLTKKNSLKVYFKLELFNSSSAKYIFKIIKKLNTAFHSGKDIKMYWSCATSNEREMIDTGLDLAGMCDFPFKISHL
ncbi:MAG: SiaC family regulatory phosphoprotein [Bacteroidota bacterium]